MEEDVWSISGIFGACIVEEAEKSGRNYGLIRRASARFFGSIKRARRSISGSLTSVLSRQNINAEKVEKECPSKKSNSTKGRRPRSFAFGEEFSVFSIPTDTGESSISILHVHQVKFLLLELINSWYVNVFFFIICQC